MKILLVNGSPHKNGSTNRALQEVEKVLSDEGLETEIYWIGAKPAGGCIGCFKCENLKKCVFEDKVNEFRQKAYEADGFVFGSPVHYAGMSGNLVGGSAVFLRFHRQREQGVLPEASSGSRDGKAVWQHRDFFPDAEVFYHT